DVVLVAAPSCIGSDPSQGMPAGANPATVIRQHHRPCPKGSPRLRPVRPDEISTATYLLQYSAKGSPPQVGSEAGHGHRPVARRGLPVEPHRRVPGGVVPVEQ